MNCDNINKFIVWTLALIIVADILILYAEMQTQNCDKVSEQELEDTLTELKEEIKNLKEEIELLKQQ